MRLCTFPDCTGHGERRVYAQGLCKSCYDRLLYRPPGRAGVTLVPARVHLTLAQTGRGRDDCWPWPGYVEPRSGYGQVGNGWAHRLAVECAGGEIPEGHDVDHSCHAMDSSCAGGPTCLHRRCVNFRHLVVMPAGMNRCQTAPTRRLTCSNEHPKATFAYQLTTTGIWRCRACDRDSQVRYAARRAERRAA